MHVRNLQVQLRNAHMWVLFGCFAQLPFLIRDGGLNSVPELGFERNKLVCKIFITRHSYFLESKSTAIYLSGREFQKESEMVLLWSTCWKD